MNYSLYCPLLSRNCEEAVCAWYDKGNKCCAVLSIVVELIKLKGD